MAMNWVRRLAASAPVPLFVAVGEGAEAAVDALCIDPAVRRVTSPRHASVLLVAGTVRPEDREALCRLHDQLPHPRATLRWGPIGVDALDALDASTTIPASADPIPVLGDLYRRLLERHIESEPHLLADRPPVEWRGKGEHGQGGKGMMGGTPYGRPMAMTGDDLRDGLALDAYTVELGPFLSALPAGLVLEVTLQGDVIQRASALRPPYANASDAHESRQARAACALRRVARMLVLLELPAQAMRCQRLAARVTRAHDTETDVREVQDLRAALQRGGVRAALPAGLGLIDATLAEAMGVTELSARARLARWLDDAEGALNNFATSATHEHHAAQAPRVAPQDALVAHHGVAFTDLLVGLEWHEATLVLASLESNALRRTWPDPAKTSTTTASAQSRGHLTHKHQTDHDAKNPQ
jgi:hypothetical protein